jgi:hypothetical protein
MPYYLVKARRLRKRWRRAFCVRGPGLPGVSEENVIDVQVGLHVFMVTLVFGTVWRLLSYHAMASPNVHLQHVGMAMATQY